MIDERNRQRGEAQESDVAIDESRYHCREDLSGRLQALHSNPVSAVSSRCGVQVKHWGVYGPRFLGPEVTLKGFKQFLLRGNVIDLAVAVVLGAAFGAVVTALVKDLITPLIAAIVGKPDFSQIAFTVNGSKFMIGDFLNAVVSFLLIASAVYFFIVLPVNAIMARLRRGETPPDPATKNCPECLSVIPIAARRCSFCTSTVD
jgi:large conductance mechanosensitive channel